MEQSFDWLVTATGSTGTQGGLVSGISCARSTSADHGDLRSAAEGEADRGRFRGLVARALEKIEETGIAVGQRRRQLPR